MLPITGLFNTVLLLNTPLVTVVGSRIVEDVVVVIPRPDAM